MFLDNPHLLADRNINPKISDVYNLFNKWRKTNLGERTGKQLFTDLEKRIHTYNDLQEEKQWFTDFVRIMTKMVMTSH